MYSNQHICYNILYITILYGICWLELALSLATQSYRSSRGLVQRIVALGLL